jgi:hypothetical protein
VNSLPVNCSPLSPLGCRLQISYYSDVIIFDGPVLRFEP